MAKLFGDTTIQDRVMAIVKQKIALGQKELDEARVVNEGIYHEEIRIASEKLVRENERKAQEIVQHIVGKFI